MQNKFRVWDVDNGRYLENSYSEEWFIGMDGSLYCNEWTGDACGYEMGVIEFPCDLYTVEFFTGFSDKNGREIYEGHLITHRHSDQPHRVFFGKEQGCFYAKYAESKMSCMPLAMLHEREIIGTVHDVNSSEKANSSGGAL